MNGTKAQAFVPANTDPEYSSPEEAEASFIKLLRQCKVQPDWTWEQTLPTIMKDPQFRAIKDPKQRKLVFQKYCNDVVAQDKERAKERLAKGHPEECVTAIVEARLVIDKSAILHTFVSKSLIDPQHRLRDKACHIQAFAIPSETPPKPPATNFRICEATIHPAMGHLEARMYRQEVATDIGSGSGLGSREGRS
ncbi:hypothetical protein V8F20_005417 [Naviculisporaceae sp. PSN 640]